MYLQAQQVFIVRELGQRTRFIGQASVTARWHSRTIRLKFRGVRRSLRQAYLAGFYKEITKF
jgi:hypothetical protein